MNAQTVMVSVADLRAAVGLLLDAVEQRFGSEFDLEADYYWDLNSDALWRQEPPTDDDVWCSQLSDDVESVRYMLAHDVDEVVIWHDLAHLVGPLRRLAWLDTQ